METINFRKNGSSVTAFITRTDENGETTEKVISDLELLIKVEPQYGWLEPILRIQS